MLPAGVGGAGSSAVPVACSSSQAGCSRGTADGGQTLLTHSGSLALAQGSPLPLTTMMLEVCRGTCRP